MAHSGQLRRFDFIDPALNAAAYNSTTPPHYQINGSRCSIKCGGVRADRRFALTKLGRFLAGTMTKTYLYYSPSDDLADIQDIEEFLIPNLPAQYVKVC